MRNLRLFSLTFLGLLFAANASAQRYDMVTIDFPGAVCSQASGINDSGQIVGTYNLDSSCSISQGYLLDRQGNFSTVDFPGASFTTAQGINPSRVVGVYGSGSQEFGYWAHERRDGEVDWYQIAFFGAAGTAAQGINLSDQIVGTYTYTGSGSNNSFLLSGGFFTTIDPPGSAPPNGSSEAFGINSSGAVVGVYGTAGPFTENQGYMLANDVYTTINFPGASLTRAYGINDRGQIVGDYQVGKRFYAFLLDVNGTFTKLDVPGATSTHAYGINDNGLIVGAYTDTSGNTHGVLAIPR